MKNLKNKLALITGGSSGIGLACAKILARMQTNLILVARDEEKLASAVALLKELAVSPEQMITYFRVDVANHAEVETAAREIQARYGPPDLIINSAGVVHPGQFTALDLEKFSWMMDINYHGTVNVLKFFLPAMVERQSGHIVNISSMAGFMGVYGYSAYGASKFAVRGLSDALRVELKPHHVQVSIVFPPDTDTPQLAYENRYKDAVLLAAEEGIPALSPDVVAQAIVKGILKDRYIITPGFISSFFFWLNGLTGGGLFYRIIDLLAADAFNKVRRNPGKYSHHHVT